MGYFTALTKYVFFGVTVYYWQYLLLLYNAVRFVRCWRLIGLLMCKRLAGHVTALPRPLPRPPL